jgi:hypothetical protein
VLSLGDSYSDQIEEANATAKEKEKKAENMVKVGEYCLATAGIYLDQDLPRSRYCQGCRGFSVDFLPVIAMLGKSDINWVWAQVRMCWSRPVGRVRVLLKPDSVRHSRHLTKLVSDQYDTIPYSRVAQDLQVFQDPQGFSG